MNEITIRIMTAQEPDLAEQELRNAISAIGYTIEDVVIDENVS